MENLEEVSAESPTPQLNERLMFENFVVGDGNQLAYSAAHAFAEAADDERNVLFIHGDCATGKTHLAHATANRLISNDRNAGIAVLTGESFVSDVVHAYRTRSFGTFRQKYQSLDLLVIDDIDCFTGKARTQEEMINILDSLALRKRKFLATSSIPLDELSSGFMSKLLSLLGGGLSVKLSPSTELLIEIAKQKARILNYVLADDAARFLVKSVGSDIRAIEGSLSRIVVYEKIRPLTLDIVQKALIP